jgi:peptide deformylase
MSVLEIITIGHETLKKRAEDIRNINDEIVQLAKSMVETMHKAPGIGLAAPQVDKSVRLIVVDLSVGEKKEDLFVLVNPEILESDGEDTAVEGCLSVPDVQEKVTRPFRALIRGRDLDGKERTLEAENFLARVFCHEIDHLDGKLFIDRLSPLKKSLIRKKLKKQLPL